MTGVAGIFWYMLGTTAQIGLQFMSDSRHFAEAINFALGPVLHLCLQKVSILKTAQVLLLVITIL